MNCVKEICLILPNINEPLSEPMMALATYIRVRVITDIDIAKTRIREI